MIIKRRSQHPDNIAALQISQAYQESGSLPRNPQQILKQCHSNTTPELEPGTAIQHYIGPTKSQ